MTDQGDALSEADPGIHARLERVAAALRSHNIEAIIVDSNREAKEVVLGLIPEGAEVHSGKSKTLEDVGLFAELIESGRYDALRTRLAKMDRATQGAEMRGMTATPDFMLGSVAAITDDGALVAASATGSQLAGYVYGAGCLVAGTGGPRTWLACPTHWLTRISRAWGLYIRTLVLSEVIALD